MEMVDSLLQLARAFPRILSNEHFRQLLGDGPGIKGQDMTQVRG